MNKYKKIITNLELKKDKSVKIFNSINLCVIKLKNKNIEIIKPKSLFMKKKKDFETKKLYIIHLMKITEFIHKLSYDKIMELEEIFINKNPHIYMNYNYNYKIIPVEEILGNIWKNIKN